LTLSSATFVAELGHKNKVLSSGLSKDKKLVYTPILYQGLGADGLRDMPMMQHTSFLKPFHETSVSFVAERSSMPIS
jgi:hypothetical protein